MDRTPSVIKTMKMGMEEIVTAGVEETVTAPNGLMAEVDCAADRPGGMAALSWTRRTIDLFGDRPAGTDRCRNAAKLIAADFEKSCDRVELQSFECSPLAFIWHGSILAVAIIGAGVLMYAGQLGLATALFAVAAILSFLQFGLYLEIFDRFFPKGRCSNVVGIIEPKETAVRQIVLSAHHDSAFEFRYLRHSRQLHVIAMVWYGLSAAVMPLVAGGLAIYRAWAGASISESLLKGLAIFSCLGGLAFLGLFSRKSVPGAGDNLVSSGILVQIAETLRERLRYDANVLNGTRVILASFDGEESGLRGSHAFVRDNQKMLAQMPTFNLNLESFFESKHLSYLVTDQNGFVRLSRALCDIVIEEAFKEGLRIAPMRMFYGLGATDAASFAKKGIPATTILAIPHDFFGTGEIIYHTRRDVPENLDPTAVEAGYKIALRVIERVSKLSLA